ncbi:MAG: S-layer homology domain-containing protein [Clostridia bacterium]|nr:S-layer homology domain-containing protein [Clostridia bacterium]
MKRILSLFLAFAMIFSSAFAMSFTDVPRSASYADAVENLTNLGIVSGYNGEFNPSGKLSRAEIAKIVVKAGGFSSYVADNSGIIMFDDVKLGEWYTGYVNTVARQRILIGYPDGKFMPDKSLTYAEATTIILRLLGYTPEVLGDNWPYAYMIKAKDLGITGSLSFGDNDYITRADFAVIMDKALKCNKYNSDKKLMDNVSALDLSDPVVVSGSVSASLSKLGVSDFSSVRVIKDGYMSEVSAIELDDVIYLCEDNDTVYVYSDKVSGIYEEAYPSKLNPVTVTISGKTFEIETSTAEGKLGERDNSYRINSRVTVLLGKDGKIVDVLGTKEGTSSTYGVILSVGVETKEDIKNENQQDRVVTVMTGDGAEVSYKTLKDYSDMIGYPGEISFDDQGYMTFKYKPNTVKVSGKIDGKNNKIGTRKLTENAKIIEMLYVPDTNTGVATAHLIELEDIKIDELSDRNVILAVESGSFNDISLLIVENVTDEKFDYGIISSNNNILGMGNGLGASQINSYGIITDGVDTMLNSDFYYSPDKFKKGTVVSFVRYGNTIQTLSALKKLDGSVCQALDMTRIKVGGEVYETAHDVQYYLYSEKGYTAMSYKTAEGYQGEKVRAYVDKDVRGNSLVRIIIFQ